MWFGFPASVGVSLVAGPAKLFFEVSQIRQTCTLPSSLIRLFHVLALPMSKGTGWDCTWVLQVGTHSAKIQVLIIASLFFPLLSQSDSQYLSTKEILQSLWDTTGLEVPKWSRMLSELNVPGLSFLTGGTIGSGEASWHGTPPTSPILIWALVVSEVQSAASASPPCSRILSVVSYLLLVVNCLPCEGEPSQEWPMSPCLWRHSWPKNFT